MTSLRVFAVLFIALSICLVLSTARAIESDGSLIEPSRSNELSESQRINSVFEPKLLSKRAVPSKRRILDAQQMPTWLYYVFVIFAIIVVGGPILVCLIYCCLAVLLGSAIASTNPRFPI